MDTIAGEQTKILATIGALDGNGSCFGIEQIIAAGADGIRINFSHANHADAKKQIRWVRELAAKLDTHVFIVADLAGPKIRLGKLAGRLDIQAGDELALVYGIEQNDGFTLPIQYDIAPYVRLHQRIFLFDGKVEAEIIAVDGCTVLIRALSSGYLTSYNGINLPDSDFTGDPITAKDQADLKFILKEDFDFICMSFVRSSDDIQVLRKILSNHGSRAQIIAKIETKAAVQKGVLGSIVRASDGVMVARGDMAYEIGVELVPVVQWRIVDLCKKYQKFSIVATQMLASMVDNPRPTRAETSDVAHAVLEGVNVTMLSEETALGKYPVEAVTEMRRIITAITRYLQTSNYGMTQEDGP